MRFVLVDRFVDVTPGRRASAVKTFDARDPLFRDHFPLAPIVPGVLLVEAIGQTAGWLLALQAEDGRWPLLAMIESAKFRRAVEPGEEITLSAEIVDRRDDVVRVKGDAAVRGERAADAHLLFHLTNLPARGNPAERLAWARERFAELGLESFLSKSGSSRA